MSRAQHLRRVHGPDGERVYHLEGTARLGRAPDNEIVVDEDGVSRRHCEFEWRGDQLHVRDLGSTNGVFVNGARVSDAALRRGDVLVIGRATFVVGGEDGAGAAPAEAASPASARPLGGRVREEEPTQAVSPGAATIEIAFSPEQSEYRPQGIERRDAERHLAALARFMDAIPRAARPEDLMEPALSAVAGALGFAFGAVFVGRDASAVEAARFASPGSEGVVASRTVLQRVIERGESLLASDDFADPVLRGAASLASQPRAALLCAPLACGDRVLGALYFADRGPRPAGAGELRLVSLVARTLALALEGLERQERAAAENALHRAELDSGAVIVAEAPPMRAALELAERVARSDATVLLSGETGTGKELLARAIHRWSPRRRGPFIAINCGAIPAAMVESELFGHEKGAFTGAAERRLGRFELADRGTLFLDEIGELPPDAQVKLLRVIEERRFYRVGGQKEVEVDVRLLVATNRDLDAAVAENRFRRDLLYRVRVVEVRVPPLRERREDIAPITDSLLEVLAPARRGRPLLLTDAARERLARHDWPGNVRELRNVIERAVILAQSDVVDAGDLLLGTAGAAPPAAPSRDPSLASLEQIEKEHIRRVLESTGWNKVRAAEVLGIGRTNLYEKIRLFGLKPES